MPCILDDERINMLLDNIENDSSQCVFRLSDLSSFQEMVDIAEVEPELFQRLEAARKKLDEFQNEMDAFRSCIIQRDDTEYFEDGGLSNMGWIMVSRFLRNGIAVPSFALLDYMLTRTKNDERVNGAITRLLRQGLIERRRLLVPQLSGIHTSERIETCYCLTDKGLQLCEDDSFIYTPSYTDGKKMANLNVNNVLKFPEKQSEQKTT